MPKARPMSRNVGVSDCSDNQAASSDFDGICFMHRRYHATAARSPAKTAPGQAEMAAVTLRP